MDKDYDGIVNFLFEAGILAKTPRSFVQLLGSGEQSVAEHTNRVVYIGYTLAALTPDANVSKVLKMCLFHDFAEGRTSDLHYVHQKYAQANDDQAWAELAPTLPFGDELKSLYEEYKARATLEAQLAKDADQLELIMSLKEQVDIGNSRANTWLPSAIKRLKTEVAQKLATKILITNSDEWWFSNKQDEWWVSRNKEVGQAEMVLQVGVKVALRDDTGRYLLIKRNPATYPEVPNPWDIIGGRIHNGFPLRDNLAREVKEEIGLDLVGEPQLLGAQDILRIPGRHVVRLTYTGQATGQIDLDPKEHTEYRWFTLEELKSLEGMDEYAKAILV